MMTDLVQKVCQAAECRAMRVRTQSRYLEPGNNGKLNSRSLKARELKVSPAEGAQNQLMLCGGKKKSKN